MDVRPSSNGGGIATSRRWTCACPFSTALTPSIRFARIDPAARIILLTTFDGEEDIYRGLRAGAKAYLLKDAPRDDILACIREVHGGGTVVPPAVAAKLAGRVSWA